MDGRRHKNALSHGCRHLEDRMGNQAAYLFVHQTVFTLPRSDMEFFSTDLIVERIAVQTGGIYHGPCFIASFLRHHTITFRMFRKVCLFYCQHSFLQMELHPVHSRILRQGDVQFEGADDASGRCMEGADHSLRKGRLQCQKFFFLQDLQPLYPVLFPLLQEFFQMGAVLLVKTKHQGTVPLIREVQLSGKLLQLPASADVHFGLPAAGSCIKTGMGDAAVCLGGAGTDILPFFKQCSLQIIAGKLSCDR